MISRISGKIIERGNNYLVVEISGLAYQVFLPTTVMQRIDGPLAADGSICLQTFHYLQSDQAKSIPVLIGFLNDIEKDFFEIFILQSETLTSE